MTTYPIHERFKTFQGEGVHMGCPAFFIRTFGCPVHCPWCDSAGTWHPKWVPKDVERLSVAQLVDEVRLAHVPIVVITGGEPTMLNLEPLSEGLRELWTESVFEPAVHLETSGGFEINGEVDWVTLSPKRWKPPIAENVMLADEFKLIIEHPKDIEFYCEMLRKLGLPEPFATPIWLHPEWSHRNDPAVLEAIVNEVKLNAGNFRAGWQLHKLYQVDAFDKRTRPFVPLGGDPAKGL